MTKRIHYKALYEATELRLQKERKEFRHRLQTVILSFVITLAIILAMWLLV